MSTDIKHLVDTALERLIDREGTSPVFREYLIRKMAGTDKPKEPAAKLSDEKLAAIIRR